MPEVRLIDKEASLKLCSDTHNPYHRIIREFLLTAPTVDAEPVRHGRWIPCSERLPDVDTNVLIYYPKWQDAPLQTAHIMSDGICWEFSDGEFYPSMIEITHWMPLPEPPEKG